MSLYFGPGKSEDELLLDATRTPQHEPSQAREGDELETLGAWDMVAGLVGWVPEQEDLRRALKDWLENDRTFDVCDPDDVLYKAMEKRVGKSVDFMITGHTHLPRAMTYAGGAHYYNCGTWIRTLRLTQQVLDDEKAFAERLWPVLRAGRLADLDLATIPGEDGDVPLLFDRTNAVRVKTERGYVVGDLLRVTEADNGGVNVDPEASTSPLSR